MTEQHEWWALLASDEVESILKEYPKLKRATEALTLKAKHTAQSVNTIRGTMQINREHKDVFGGAVYLVDHTHMWALVRNAEDLEAYADALAS